MDKILTISIAAYNVEKFIGQTLDSCLGIKSINDIEILVLDDGATDNTAKIVKEYETKFPQIVRLLQKDNGGYGTTVNRSIREANGIYFKLLDGDDWFNVQGLENLVSILKISEADIIFNKMYKVYSDHEVQEKDTWEEYTGKIIPLSTVKAGIHAGMWEMTIKTSVLKQDWIDLPGKTLYTDHFFIMQAIPTADKVMFLDFPVYCYRLGYGEQSVSVSSRKKHVEDIIAVSKLVSKYYHEYCKMSNNSVFARERARFTYMEAHRTLMILPCRLSNLKRVRDFDLELKAIDRDIYDESVRQKGKRSLLFIRKTGYWGYFIIVIKDRIIVSLRKLRTTGKYNRRNKF